MDNQWTCASVYLGGDRKPDLVFIGDKPVAYFKQCGEYDKPTVYVLQGMNRDEFRVNLIAHLPDFCRANDIDDKTVFDIYTRRELDLKASV